MPDLTLTASVTRTQLALADLSIGPANGYYITPDTGPGAVSWRRDVARSPFTHGEVLVGAVKDIEMASLGVRVEAATSGTLWSRMRTLLDAFEQFSYDLTLVINGVTFTWECEPADYAVGASGEFQKFHLMAIKQEVRFEIPRHPVPKVGGV